MTLVVMVGDAHAQASAEAAARAGLEEGLVTAQLYQISRRDLITYFAGDSLYLPYTAIAQFLGIIHRTSEDLDTLSGEFPTGSPFAFIVSDQTFRRNGTVDTLAPRSLRIVGNEVVVEFNAFNHSLTLKAEYDVEQLMVTIPPDRSIPAVDVKTALRKYARLGKDGAIESVEQDITELSRSAFGAIGFDWGLNSMTIGDKTSGAGNFGLSTPFLYGVLGLRGRAGFNPTVGAVDFGFEGANWRLELPEVPMLRMINLGFNPGGGSPSYSIGLGGASERDLNANFGTRELSGTAEPGWWAELYDGATLIAATKVGDDGTYSFEVPLESTRATRRVQLRGPHGERTSELRTFAVAGDMLPVGDYRWSAGGSTFTHMGERAVSGNFNVTAGIFDRLTLDVSTKLPGVLASNLAFDSLRSSIGVRLALFDATPISFTIDPHNLRFGTTFTLNPFDVLPMRFRMDSVDVRKQTYSLGMSTRIALGPLGVGTTARIVNRWDRRGYEINPSMNIRLLGVTLNASMRTSHMERFAPVGENTAGSIEEDLQFGGQMSFSLFRFLRMRFGANFDALTSELTSSSAGISFPITRMFSLNCSYSVSGTDWKHGAFGANLGVNLPFTRGSVSSTYDDGHTTVYSRLNGSMVLSSIGADIVPENVVSRAQLFVVGYHDRNRNGEYDGDDESLGPADVELSMRNGSVLGSGTKFEMIPASRNLIVAANGEQFAGLGLYPLRSNYELAIQSGITEVLHIPFAEGEELYGTGSIRLPSGRNGHVGALLGVRVRLVSVDGVAEYLSEFINDGTYYLAGVAPGEYRIVLDEAALSAIGLAVDDLPSSFVIEPGSGQVPEIVFVPLSNDSSPSDADDFVE